MNLTSLPRHYEHLTTWERVRLRLAAQARKDEVEERRLQDTATVLHTATLPHLQTEMVLHTFALMYLAEQLEAIAWHFFAQMKLREGDITAPEVVLDLAGISGTNAYCFHVKTQGWKKFCRSIDVDPDALVAGNHDGLMLKFCEDKMVKFAPTAEELTDWFRSKGDEPGPLISVESEYRSWRRLLEKATHEPPLFEDAPNRSTPPRESQP